MASRQAASRKIFTSIWGVHFIRGFLKKIGLVEASPEYRKAVEWFQTKTAAVAFEENRADVRIDWAGWTTLRDISLGLDEIEDFSIERILSKLADLPGTVIELVDGRYSRALDKTLERSGVELYPFTTVDLTSPVPVNERDIHLTRSHVVYVVLCVGAKLLEDGEAVRAINDRYSWRALKERGYSMARPVDLVVPGTACAMERALRPLPPWRNPGISKTEALQKLLDFLPADLPPGSSWMNLFPSRCTPWPTDYYWMQNADERATLAKLAGRVEQYVKKARAFLRKDADPSLRAYLPAATPWTDFKALSWGADEEGRFPLAVVFPQRFVPVFVIQSTTNGFEENLAHWKAHGLDRTARETHHDRWSFWEDCVLALLYMPHEEAAKQPGATVLMRALARLAWVFFAGSAVAPLPVLHDHTNVFDCLWLPRLDLPGTGGAFDELCALAAPFLDELIFREKPYKKEEPGFVRKTVLVLFAHVLRATVNALAKESLVTRYESNPVSNFIALRLEISTDPAETGRLKRFFALPIALAELPGRPALKLQKTEDGAFVLARGIVPFEDAKKGPDFLEERKLTPTNRARLRIALDRVMLAEPEASGEDDLPQANKYLRRRPAGVTVEADEYRIRTEDFESFLVSGISEIRAFGVELKLPKDVIEIVHPDLCLTVDEGEAISGSFLNACALADFDWHGVLEGLKVPKALILKLIEEAGHIVEFGGRSYYISREDALALKERLHDPELAPGRLDAWEKLRAVLTGNFKGFAVEPTDAARQKLQKLLRVESLPVPPELTATLRPYQERGFSWIMKNLRLGLGALIADDMGLGKTLQVIAALQQLKNDGELDAASVLVVAPASIMVNWQREFEKFAPAITVSLYHGTRRRMAEEKAHTDVVITSYGTFRRDAEALATRAWRLMVLDEAQAIKNFLTHQSKAARLFPVPQVIGMTGTPVENRLLDYWSILAAVQPGLLGGKTAFQREFVTPIESGGPGSFAVLKRFQALTAPFILRRLKTDKSIMADLPEKRVIDRFTTLNARQLVLYRQSLKTGLSDLNALAKEAEETQNEALAEVAQRLMMKRRGRILMMITQLKQITNSPALFEKKTAPKPDSGKGEALIDLLEEARDAGNKTLVFTQYREMGELLAGWIQKAKLGIPLFLHGGVPLPQRTAMVDRFQKDPKCTIMIITLKAGGTGLNLTAASVVIHYDLWWNPAVENQATDRAHRIGQEKDVLVYRFVTAGTFEERVNKMLEAKRKLADLTVLSREKWIGEMSDKEIAEIFRTA